MSAKVTSWIWDADLERDEKFIMLAYADMADHEGGSIMPSNALIAWMTGYSLSSVKRIKAQLIVDSYLIPTGEIDSKYGTIVYRIDQDKLPERPLRKQSDSQRGRPKINQAQNKPSLFDQKNLVHHDEPLSNNMNPTTIPNSNKLELSSSGEPLPDPAKFTVDEFKLKTFAKSDYESLLTTEMQGKGRKTLIAHFQRKIEFYDYPEAYKLYCKILAISGNPYEKTASWQSAKYHEPDDRAKFEGITDLVFFEKLLLAWKDSGYKERNLKGILDCYKERRIPGEQNGHTNGNHNARSKKMQYKDTSHPGETQEEKDKAIAF